MAQFIKLIDAFGTTLSTHLGEEIPTLLALDKSDTAEVNKIWIDWDKAMQAKADLVSADFETFSAND